MKKLAVYIIPLILYATVVVSSCTSTPSRNMQSEKEVSSPKWITDEGRMELFPRSLYISQVDYGNTPQECKEKATASISRFIKSSVVASSNANFFYKETASGLTQSKELKQNILVNSESNLYKLEYTNPYYNADRAQYACVAYINKEQAFDFVRPKLEIARTKFPPAYYAALERDSLLDTIIGIKTAQGLLPGFYEVYDFARAILPEKTKPYEDVDVLASESVLKLKTLASSVLIKIEGCGDTDLLEKSGVIAELSNQFKNVGFVVGKSLQNNCLALVEVTSVITETQKTFETYPELSIKILEKGAEKISYVKKLPKVAGFDRETVIRRTNLALTKEIQTSFVNECF